ncbi:hypothetical protein TRFO_04468 [Tritrichomonas foetus]|uniref:Uncharacterized protein n=1 Tax=Tritrichomonas foetus TaxID=1144522 RepID=A0A1J4KG46_9EUKA|nr:hypothetical protein TRFO_04468 [Tritrichomonas foetus]|eukprot:OHT09912.1 hypothetical protein TRFO_04468 [Tritrichomonas foetus]
MSGVSSLTFRNVLGISRHAKPNVLFAGEEYIVFPAGNSVVVHNINSRQQRHFLPPEKFSSGISAIAIADSKPNVAFGDNFEGPSICIFDIHTMHPRNFLHLGVDFGSEGFISLSFSGDGKYLLAHGGKPGWALVVWDWESSQTIASVKTAEDVTPVTQCSFSPGKNPQIAVTGNNILKIYKLENNKLSEMIVPDPKIGNIVCHLWLNETILLCANSSGDVIAVTTNPQASVLDEKKDFEHRDSAIVAMARHKKGFLTASEGGYLTVYDATAKPNVFAAVRTVQLFTELPLAAHSIAVDPSEEIAIISMEKNKLVSVSLSNGDFMLNTEEKPLMMPFHDGPIHCCSPCSRKPLIATCGADKTVRVWNYLDNSLEILKEFTESVYCVSFHPDGLSMLIGFGDKLRLCSVFYDDIRIVKDFPIRGCRCVKFSNGGQMFAAVNGSKIQIYSALTYQLINTLHRHSATVHDLIWGECDTVIASVGNDGAMYIHRQDNASRDESYTTAQTTYYSITASPDFSSLYICGSDNSTNNKDQTNAGNNNKIKEIQNGQVVREMFFGTAHKQIVMSNNGQMLFSGDAAGRIYSYALSIGGDKIAMNVHEKQVTSMAISYDDSLLFSTSDDGVLCVYNIRDKDNRVRNPERSFFSDEVQTTRTELEEKANQLRTFKAEHTDLEMSFKMKKELIESTHKSKEDKHAEKAKKTKDKNRILYENKKKEKDEIEMQNNSYEQELNKRNEDMLTEKEEEYSKQVFAAHQICENYIAEKERLEKQWNLAIQKEENEHKRIIEELQATHRKRLQSAHMKLQEAQEKKASTVRQIEEMKKEITAERESSVHQTDAKLAQILAEDEKMKATLNDEHVNRVKECAKLQKTAEQQQIERNKLTEQKDKLQGQLNDLNKEIERLNEEIRQKSATINDRELKIKQVKKENRELEKYHSVLTHQEQMLKQQIGPLNQQIAKEEAEIAGMDSQLEAAHKKTTDMNELISELQNRLKQVIQQERVQTTKLTNAKSYFEQAKHDLHEVVQFFHAKDMLKSRFEGFYNTYVKNEKIEDIQLDECVEEEHRRQKTTLQKQLKELRQQHLKDDQFQSKEQTKLLMQNAQLIEELQRLRIENKRETQNAALMTKKPTASTKPLLPATEAQRLIDENKKKIMKLEEQLASYNNSGSISSRPA